MNMNSNVLVLLLGLVAFATVVRAEDPPEFTNEADELATIHLHSFEHFDYLDILYKLMGHNSDTWICLFYIDEDHHKTERDRVKKLIFKDNPELKYCEANISEPQYAPLRNVIRFPQHASADEFPMILILKNKEGKMVYGTAVAKKAADIIKKMKEAEEAEANNTR
ncbi:unnamed protein product [Moneuplotes crassus]|uniref:Thioredoxin domain-containing protein n=1 Tax=Euplotes crassus TaxID=5936 RepID=A0A7S3P0Y0_EUPCR|nr:unnamed protein product [Moneuplotes crassus]|mmetsp:Transcript_4010/g.3789  ORF Transcript_4010/g.3789 Transcript_4010/m.3789 type:complete len:166 (+) Transcript_4010:12-509(+)